jgi:ubiquinone/menaquinone biosynthesis C-methylase UbiE
LASLRTQLGAHRLTFRNDVHGCRLRIRLLHYPRRPDSQLKRDAAEEGLKNIHAEVAAAEETVFCNACADIVFCNTVLHDFRDPAKVLRNARLMLKPSGKLVNVDWKKKPTEFGPPVPIRFSEEHAARLIKQAGFTIESVEDLESDFYIVTAKPQPSR